MEPDPLIDEIHEIRRQISAEFGHDPKRLVAYYMERERDMRRSGQYKFRDAPVEQEDEESLLLREKPMGT